MKRGHFGISHFGISGFSGHEGNMGKRAGDVKLHVARIVAQGVSNSSRCHDIQCARNVRDDAHTRRFAMPERASMLPRMRPALLFSLTFLPLACMAFATEPRLPEIPANTVSITDHGARGDGTTDNTKAIQTAINAVAKTGGMVTIPEGVYLCGPITLASRVGLHLAKGATLRLPPLSDSFPSANGRYLNFISARDCTDIKISGEGTIDGQGGPWWTAFTAKKIQMRRPQLIAFENCGRVLFESITTLNPPNTHFALRLCKDVTMRGLTLRAPGNSRNTDGINISGKNYLITGCDISTGDDNIVILTHAAKDWSKPVCENFIIRDCTFGEGHGMSIGSHTGGGVRGVLVENCAFDGTTAAIRMKSRRDNGGLVENLTYRNLTVKGARYPLFISSYYPKEPETLGLDTGSPAPAETKPRWKNILIENLTVTDSQNSIIIWGLPELPVSELTLCNARFATREGAVVYNARAIRFDNVEIQSTNQPLLKTHNARIDGMTGGVEVE
jgi:polygalacturonase